MRQKDRSMCTNRRLSLEQTICWSKMAGLSTPVRQCLLGLFARTRCSFKAMLFDDEVTDLIHLKLDSWVTREGMLDLQDHTVMISKGPLICAHMRFFAHPYLLPINLILLSLQLGGLGSGTQASPNCTDDTCTWDSGLHDWDGGVDTWFFDWHQRKKCSWVTVPTGHH